MLSPKERLVLTDALTEMYQVQGFYNGDDTYIPLQAVLLLLDKYTEEDFHSVS